MSYEQTFLADFEQWVNQQVTINQIAMDQAHKVWKEDKDARAEDAFIRYESKLDAYRFLQGKFANYHNKKDFYDMPDDLFGKRTY